uniref:Uncharacterized protein n=1 Tax=Physcomitrium patens TaxID=3218 RepID=A0A7I4DPY6_PHYPA|nr:uncharacterized protein LOC112282052 isoform X4 [Physcomitrium patens]|eukprot:XP_024374963.1 uncharacterized protein LOC112282052 isoform X4 [Physcomitrella patens]
MAVETRIPETTASRNTLKASKQMACGSQSGALKRQVAASVPNSTKALTTKLPATKPSESVVEKNGPPCGKTALNRKEASNKSLGSIEQNESKHVSDLEEPSLPEIEMQYKDLDVIDSSLQAVSWFPVGDVELDEFWELKADHNPKSGLTIQSLTSGDPIPLIVNEINGSSSELEGAVCREFLVNQRHHKEKQLERGICVVEQEISLKEPDVIKGLEMKNGLHEYDESAQASSNVTSEGITDRTKQDFQLTKPSGKLVCHEGYVFDVFRGWRTKNVVIPSVLVMITVWFCVENTSGDVLGILPPT